MIRSSAIIKTRPVLVVSLLMVVLLAGCSDRDREEESHPAMEGMEDGWEITITLLGGTNETRHVFPSEKGHDFDKDGQDDLQEFHQGTDPNDADTSRNGLLDGENVILGPEESPAKEWIDRGIVHKELEDGRLEFQGTHRWRVDPTMQDTDEDLLMDGDEIRGFDVWVLGEARNVTTEPFRFDTSGDSISDGEKRDLGLDPTTRDTDGDGVPDRSDVNPWIDFAYRLEVDSLDLSGGRDSVNLRLQATQESWEIPFEEGSSSISDTLDPSDDGGDFSRGNHNSTFALTALSSDGGSAVDLFSHTTGSSSLIGAIHALTGELSVGQGDREPWPQDATFTGDDGSVTLRIVPVWPAEWQSCVDDGCRHGDDEFPWR